MKPQTREILWLLRARRTVTQQDAIEALSCYRLAARVSELREAGYDIRCEKSKGYGRYTLIEEPEQMMFGGSLGAPVSVE